MPAAVKSKISGVQIYHAKGCAECKDRGLVGRIAIFEVLKMTAELQQIINSGVTELKIAEESRRQGMITIRQDGILKALEGLVSIEEVLRETTE